MNIINYLGKFHPLAVHLPIGILIIFLIVALFVPRNKLKEAQEIVKILLLVSAISASISSASGYILGNSGSYDVDSVTGHQLLGIALTILNWILLFSMNYLYKCKILVYKAVMIILFVMVVLTGHAGGVLTHGSDFLTPPALNDWFSSNSSKRAPLTIESTSLEVASVIFTEKCLVCHGKNKQKGKLRLDTKDSLIKGGKSGDLITKDPSTSLLIERILLSEDHEDHMPPKEKKQLSELEINYLIWWIESGTNFDKKLSELSFPDSLHKLLSPKQEMQANNLIPVRDVSEADGVVIEHLGNLGVIVTPIGEMSNYLSVDFINVSPENLDAVIELLVGIKEQLVWLDLDYHNMNQDSWKRIGMLEKVRKLHAKDTNLDDESISFFTALGELRQLNLTGTKVSYAGLESIKSVKKLESLFLYQTGINSSEFEKIQQLFPGAEIDFGNYFVPTFKSDTTEFRKEDL